MSFESRGLVLLTRRSSGRGGRRGRGRGMRYNVSQISWKKDKEDTTSAKHS